MNGRRFFRAALVVGAIAIAYRLGVYVESLQPCGRCFGPPPIYGESNGPGIEEIRARRER